MEKTFYNLDMKEILKEVISKLPKEMIDFINQNIGDKNIDNVLMEIKLMVPEKKMKPPKYQVGQILFYCNEESRHYDTNIKSDKIEYITIQDDEYHYKMEKRTRPTPEIYMADWYSKTPGGAAKKLIKILKNDKEHNKTGIKNMQKRNVEIVQIIEQLKK